MNHNNANKTDNHSVMININSNMTDTDSDKTDNTTAENPSAPLFERTSSPDAITRELYHSLKRLNRLMHRTGHQEPGRNGLFRGQAHLLETVRTHDGIVQRDLAEKLDIRPSSLTEMLSKMEQDGFTERRQDNKDQRLMHIHLTGKGMQYFAMMDESEVHQMKTLFRSLSNEEALTMLTLCNKLGSGLDHESGVEEKKRHSGPDGHIHRGQRHGGKDHEHHEHSEYNEHHGVRSHRFHHQHGGNGAWKNNDSASRATGHERMDGNPGEDKQ